jgi:hypothetical protein
MIVRYNRSGTAGLEGGLPLARGNRGRTPGDEAIATGPRPLLPPERRGDPYCLADRLDVAAVGHLVHVRCAAKREPTIWFS